MDCPQCQGSNPAGAKFCMSCGGSLLAICAGCGTELSAGAKFCHNCGSPVGAAQEDASRATLEQYIPKELLSKLEAARASGGSLGERRIVTMLFCDVTGSTSAAEKLDPEEWAEIMNGAFEHLIAPIYRYEGTLARLMGDAILAFFGAPISHEDDPQRAVLAGLDIIDSIGPYRDEVRRKWGIEFEVRVGINTGLVVMGEVGSDLRLEYTALGDAINTAARMEQTAKPGTVQIAADTHTLVSPLFDFENLGLAEVKGKSDPVQVYRVVGRKADPGQERGIEGLDSPMVGRDKELETLKGAITDLRQGQGQIISLIGDAGLGKSRIIAELRDSVMAEETVPANSPSWQEGRSRSYETAAPFTPFINLLNAHFDLSSDDEDAEKYQKIKGRMAALAADGASDDTPFLATMLGIPVPEEDGDRLKYLQPPQVREKIFLATRQLVEAMAKSSPLVLVFEDLHWADPTSLDLLESLFPLTDRVPLVIMALFRPVRQDPAWRFHEVANRDYVHRYTPITLEPLDEQDSRLLVGNLLEVEDLPESVRSLILTKAEGNPFFVEEVIRSLLDADLVVREDSHWRATKEIATIALPDTLAGIINARLDRLSEFSRSVAQTASVIGREFEFNTLAEISMACSNLEEALSDLQRRELIREKSRFPQHQYMYKHALTQEAAYSSLLLSRRRELHLRVAEYLERNNPEQVHDIARHFVAAQEQARALPYLVKMGDQAARAYSSVEAISSFKQALGILEDTKDAELARQAYEGLGGALTFSGDVPGAADTYHHMYHSAQDYGDVPMQVSALNRLGFITGLLQGEFPEAEEHLAEAGRLGRECGDFSGLAELNMTYCYMRVPFGKFEEAIEHLQEAAEIGRKLELEEPRLFGLTHIANTQIYMTDFEESRATVQEALPLAIKLGNRKWESELLGLSSAIYQLRNGNLDAAMQSAQEASDIAASIGAAEQEGYARLSLALVSWFRGEYEAAIGHYQSALQAGRTCGLPFIQVAALCGMGTAHMDISGRLFDRAREFHEEALPLMEHPLGSVTGGLAWADLGFSHLAAGLPEQAEEFFQKGLNVSTAFKFLARPLLLAGSALISLGNEDVDEARNLVREARSFAEEREMKHFYPLVSLVEGHVNLAGGDFEKALELFEQGERLAMEMGMRGFTWQTRAGAAQALMASNRPEAAAARKGEAVTMINEIGGLIQDETLRSMYLEDTLAKLS